LLSVMVGIAVFGTPITPQMIVGGVLTIIGVGIITLRTAQRRDDDDAQRRDDDRAQKRDDDTVQKRDMINE
jgi:O-acetylserine/cysteine efflux transporter